jgi:predicted DNA-binding antitoxin AbrB/MazE fold protein
MVRKLEAVYEGGVLRPVEPLRLDEHQLVSVIILDDTADDDEALQFAPRKEFETLADHTVTLDEVRKGLSRIPDSLDADFAAERNRR